MSGDTGQFKDLFEKADQFAREVSLYRNEVAIPAHNELRYAGHHIIKAVNDKGVVDCKSEDFHKAINHCERAMYEAAEAGITFLLKKLIVFRNDYKSIVVVDVVKNYHEMLLVANDARDMIVEGRKNRTSIEDHVSQYMTKFRELRKHIDTLEAARGDLNALQKREIREFRRYALTLIVLALGALFGALRLF